MLAAAIASSSYQCSCISTTCSSSTRRSQSPTTIKETFTCAHNSRQSPARCIKTHHGSIENVRKSPVVKVNKDEHQQQQQQQQHDEVGQTPNISHVTQHAQVYNNMIHTLPIVAIILLSGNCLRMYWLYAKDYTSGHNNISISILKHNTTEDSECT